MNNMERLRGAGIDWVMPAVLLAVGLPALLIALYLALDELRFRAGASLVEGVVAERQGDVASLVVEYPVNGAAKHRLETFGSDLYEDVQVGQRIGVYMDPAAPQEGRLDHFAAAWMLPLILGVFGAFFALPGAAFAYGNLRGPLRRRRLEKVGLPVPARVMEVVPVLTLAAFRRRMSGNTRLSLWRDGASWRLQVNGEEKDPFAGNAHRDWGVSYRVVAQWQDAKTGATHTCESEPIDLDPSRYLQFGTITVLVDPDDAANCRIDLSFLPAAFPG